MKLFMATRTIVAYFVTEDDAAPNDIQDSAEEAISAEARNGIGDETEYSQVWVGHRPEGGWNRGCLVYGANNSPTEDELSLGQAIDRFATKP